MRRGSLEYWPHRRAKKQMPRLRSWVELAEPSFANFVAFKTGMTHIGFTDDSNSPAKGTEIISAATVLEIPRVFIYGIRLYHKTVYKEPADEVYDKQLAAKIGIKKTEKTNLDSVKKDTSKYVDAAALAFLDPSSLGFGMKKLMRFEMHVGGKSIDEKIAFIAGFLGKEVKITNFLKAGDYIDITGITKGKGWQGPVKRFGVARLYHKATGKTRHVGTLGPFHPPKVLYSVPMAGHMGYNYRTELNKRVMKVGSAASASEINPSGAFPHYGVVRNDYLIVKGSVSGTPKRMVRIRKALRSTYSEAQPQVKYVSLTAKQG